MSKETALAFFDAVEKSPDLRRQIRPLDQREGSDIIKKFLEIAAKAGYVFTFDDLKAAAKSHTEQEVQPGAISEEDLDKVAGGYTAVGCVWTSLSQ